MISRPETHGERFVAHFQDQSVVDRYHLRPAYPPEIFAILNELIIDEPRVVLDVGCGTGNVARPLVKYVEHINPTHVPIDMIAEWEKYQLFQKQGERQTAPVAMRQSIEDYIAAQHGRSHLSLDSMTTEQAAQFHSEMQALLTPFAQDDLLTFNIVAGITWGKPLSGTM